MNVSAFTMIRLVVGYPLMIVAGLIWLMGFGLVWWVSPRGARNGPAGWAALAGLGMAIYGVAGMVSLWAADRVGFGMVTSGIFTLGQSALVGAATAGALWVLRRLWVQRQIGSTDAGQGMD